MHKVLFVTPDLEYRGAAKQLTLLAGGLPRDRFEPRVCVLGRDGPFGQRLRAAGVPVEVLGWTRPFDPAPVWNLRRLVREFRPDVVHAWRPPALRALGLAAGGAAGRLVVSAPFPARAGAARPGALDRWLLGRAARVVANGPGEAERCRRLGLPDAQLAVVPPGVEGDAGTPGRGDAEMPPVSPCPGVPASPCRFLLWAGRLEVHKGFHDAVWAFDILQYVEPDLHLVLLGDGPDRGRLRAFVRAINAEARVHFAGPLPDVAALLARAEVVWVPSRGEGG